MLPDGGSAPLMEFSAPGTGTGSALPAPGAHDIEEQTLLDGALDALRNDELDAQARALLAPIVARLNSEEDPEAFLGWLAEQFPEADAGALEEKLAQMVWAAQMWGRINGEA